MNRNRRVASVVLLSDDHDHDIKPKKENLFDTKLPVEYVEIDLTSPVKSSLDTIQRNYLPYTIAGLNQERLSILPTYPTNTTNATDQSLLLLANLPINQLSEQEQMNRQSGKYKCGFSILDIDAFATSMVTQYYQMHFGSIIERFHVDLSILDHNYCKLKKFIQLHRLAYNRTLPLSRSSTNYLNLNENEYPQLLEFYLQIDVDLFYMKTCTYRQAEPRLKDEGIYCTINPQCRYWMTPCRCCALCYEHNQPTNNKQYSVQFNLYQKHRFVNGYESILNCPSTCKTKNIIYALTCVCGNYDYIGGTSGILLGRLSDHQCFTHRLILEKLIGEKNHIRFWGKPSSTTTTASNSYDDKIQKYFNYLPKPPSGYKFSKRQIQKQYEFFIKEKYPTQPSLYYTTNNATLITVLPMDTSDLFRHLVQSLLITHAETKLNTMGHIFTYLINGPISQGLWYANLHRPHHQLSSIFKYKHHIYRNSSFLDINYKDTDDGDQILRSTIINNHIQYLFNK
ncbi:unnamed protein product [Adineta steineri]|uniref:Uncharacterized protein n=1 Tax=Adineta steineri TaxID=433720 RepID=A0A814J4S9_9BILA|nr:unnamed protein product [Adineta steineri]CAF1077252.1 unnamed protein product [Adineta steineri]